MNYQVIVQKYNDEYILYIKELSLIHKSKDLENLVQSGFNTFLIGEAFMKENNIAKMFKNLKAIDV